MNYTFESLKREIEARLCKVLKNADDISALSEYFATVDFYGVHSHGVKTLAAHIDRIERSAYNLEATFEIKKETPAFAVIDGGNGIGMLCANRCVDYAIEKSKEVGIFTVLSFNNNTYGSAFYYALRAANEGCICITSSNSPAQMAAFGGVDKVLGTNPFSIAVPAKNNPPIVIDMATSAVAKSRLNEFKAKGEPIPEGWALDKNGKPTTDAKAAIEGLMLPMAGFKGYGISMMIDVIAGALSGAAYLDSVGRFYCQDKTAMNVGFSFTVIDPSVVYGKEFYSQMDRYIEKVRSGNCAEGQSIALPGDDRLAIYKKYSQQGCELNF